jgi:hypothetical protein
MTLTEAQHIFERLYSEATKIGLTSASGHEADKEYPITPATHGQRCRRRSIMLVHGDICASRNAPSSAVLGRLASFGKFEDSSSPSTD